MFLVYPGSRTTNLDPYATANRWGGASGLNAAELALNGLVCPGGVVTPSIVLGTWGQPQPLPSGFSTLPRRVILERRVPSINEGAWVDFTSNWGVILGSDGAITDPDDYTFIRWRVPRPHTGYMRIEWDEIYFNHRTDPISEVSIASIVLDSCYQNLWVAENGELGALNPLRRVRMTPSSVSRAIVVGSSPAVTINVDVTSSEVALRGVAVEIASNVTTTAASLPVSFSPSTGAAATAVFRELPPGANLVTTASRRIYGVRLDDAGTPPTVPHTVTITGGAATVHPRYTGGQVTDITFVSSSPATFGFGATGARTLLIPTDWQSGQFKLARIICTGAIVYVAKSVEITSWPEGYNPNNKATWALSPEFQIFTDSENATWGNSRLSLPRFFISP